MGLELDQVVRAKNELLEGGRWRAMAATQVSFLPMGHENDRLVVSANLAYRREFRTVVADSDRDYTFAQLSAAVSLDADGMFRIGVDHVLGDEPNQGLVNARLVRLMLKVQFTHPQKKSREMRRALARGVAFI